MMSLLESAFSLPMQAVRVGMDLMALGWKALQGTARPENSRSILPPPDASRGSKHPARPDGSSGGQRVVQQAEPLWNGCLKLVEYQVLFVKRGLETAFPLRQELVWDCLTNEQYRIWKVAEFVQHLSAADLPDKWRRKGYPTQVADETSVRLPEEDGKYLRVWFQLVKCCPREPFRFEERQVEALWQINRSLEELAAAASSHKLPHPEAPPVGVEPPPLPETKAPKKKTSKDPTKKGAEISE